MTELTNIAVNFFKDAAQCPEGQRMLRGNVGDVNLMCQFDPKDDEPFYVEIIKGELTVKEGRLASLAYDYPRIRAYKKDLLEIFKGKIRPYAAKRAGNWEISWRDRRGGIFTVLVRIGQDVARERIIQNA
jgi:hypothetical protein